MDGKAQWIDRSEDLKQVLGRLGGGPLAVDTEADSLHHYPEKVCLIQLSFSGSDYLVDALADIDLEPLARTFADPGVLKIFHGADYDLRMLNRGFGMTFAGLFDTMIAARFLGEKKFGLAALLAAHFGVTMDKRFQRADWSVRPLTPEMAHYAAMDTHYLAELHEILKGRLVELGRAAWAEEEFRRLEAIRASPAPSADEGFRRVKGGAKLERAKLAVLRELWILRESYARELDRPPFRVLHDEPLIGLCERMPRDAGALAAIPRLPRPWRQGRRARELLEAVARGAAVPPEEWPPRSKGGRSRVPAKNTSPRLDEIKRRRDRVADCLGLEPSLIGPRALLELIAQELDKSGDPTELPDLRDWQWDLLSGAAAVGRDGP
jgi:ribonuclease D